MRLYARRFVVEFNKQCGGFDFDDVLFNDPFMLKSIISFSDVLETLGRSDGGGHRLQTSS